MLRKVFEQETRDLTNWYWFSAGFSNEELDLVNQLASQEPSQHGIIAGSKTPDTNYRDSIITWLNHGEKSDWLYSKIMGMAAEANRNLWGFDLQSTVDSIQYTEYLGGGGHYDYHLDIGSGGASLRKVSIVVQLSDPSEYDGGEFQLLRGRFPETLPKNKGAVLIFPSYLLHRVTPIESGVRRSLVMWVGGTHYK
jgi:PKHD-type hydroxylase